MGVVYNYTADEPKFQVLHDTDVIHLSVPSNTEFEPGEWVGQDANGRAVKFTNGTTMSTPFMIIDGTDRNDVKESGVLTALYGKYRLKTKMYASGQSFSKGDKVVVLTDGTESGEGKGILHKLPGTAGTYYVIGEVAIPPSEDGDWLIVDVYADPKTETVSA